MSEQNEKSSRGQSRELEHVLSTDALLSLLRRAIREEIGDLRRPQVVKISEAARLLSVSTKHVRRMVQRGALLAADIEGAMRIPMSEIDRISQPPLAKSNRDCATEARPRFDGAKALARLNELVSAQNQKTRRPGLSSSSSEVAP